MPVFRSNVSKKRQSWEKCIIFECNCHSKEKSCHYFIKYTYFAWKIKPKCPSKGDLKIAKRKYSFFTIKKVHKTLLFNQESTAEDGIHYTQWTEKYARTGSPFFLISF